MDRRSPAVPPQPPNVFAHGSGCARRGGGWQQRETESWTRLAKGVAMAEIENVVVVRFTEPSNAYEALERAQAV